MKAKTNERVIQEVKQRKIVEEQIYERQRQAAELSKYQRMDAEKKYNDIRNLLMKMNVPVQGGKAEPI
jgi:ribosomal protein S21